MSAELWAPKRSPSLNPLPSLVLPLSHIAMLVTTGVFGLIGQSALIALYQVSIDYGITLPTLHAPLTLCAYAGHVDGPPIFSILSVSHSTSMSTDHHAYIYIYIFRRRSEGVNRPCLIAAVLIVGCKTLLDCNSVAQCYFQWILIAVQYCLRLGVVMGTPHAYSPVH
jgi:hypothetical protein